MKVKHVQIKMGHFDNDNYHFKYTNEKIAEIYCIKYHDFHECKERVRFDISHGGAYAMLKRFKKWSKVPPKLKELLTAAAVARKI